MGKRGPKASPATWEDAARDLHAFDKKKYNQPSLSRIFGKNVGTIWWVLHPEWYKEFQKEKYERTKKTRIEQHKDRYQRLKNAPKYRAQRRAACKRYREKLKRELEDGTHRSVLYANFGDKGVNANDCPA